MSPLIDIQRRMAEVGRIRAGDKGPKGEPRKLTHWRLTSKDRERLDHAATLWGGDVTQWEDQWQLYTTTSALPIMLLPGHPPTSWYELWSKGGCQRRCDGQHEQVTDSACLCANLEERECKPTTRLSVLLPDVPGLGSWLLSSTGWNAAAELAGSADLLQKASAQGVLIPARLRLEQRTSARAGQTRKFAVPVIDIDVSFRQLLGGETGSPPLPELPAGYTPITEVAGNGTTLAEGLEIAHTQQVTRTARSSAPIPTLPDDIEFSPAPVAVPVEPLPILEDEVKVPTKAMNTKMDVLVTRLREANRINTEKIWSVIAAARGEDIIEMTDRLHGRDEFGDLHWAPLRKSLTRAEASRLIDWLERHEQASS